MSLKHIDYKQAEDLTGIKKGTLYALVSQKRIPHIRIGKRHVLFSIPELENWLNDHKVKTIDIFPSSRGEK